MTDFDTLSRGDQFMILLQREYEKIIRVIKIEVQFYIFALENYAYDENKFKKERDLRALSGARSDIRYYQAILDTMKGAENETPELVLTAESAESPKVTCTTVC